MKTLGNCCLVFLAIIGVLVSCLYGYYHFFIHDTTIGVNYIGSQLGVDIIDSKDLTDEEKDEYDERWFMEANYYSNDKKNGIELQELNFNYFMDFELTSDSYRSTGMQYKGDYKTSSSFSFNPDVDVNPNFIYYDTTDKVVYRGYASNNTQISVGTLLNRSAQIIISIDKKPYVIQLNGTYKKQFLFWTYDAKYYEFGDLFDCVFHAIKDNNKGKGDYYINLDLSQFFSIKEFDPITKKFKEDNVIDIIKNYAVLKVHYDDNGAQQATQSMFGMIDCNKNYGMENREDITYWQERMVYNINNDTKLNGKKIIDYRYSEIYKGYFISLSMEAKKIFEDMPRRKVNITIDLNTEDRNIVGIDYNGFENFEIDTFTINGENQTFYMLDKALYNTNLQTLKYTNGITFDMADDSINSEYTGVIL